MSFLLLVLLVGFEFCYFYSDANYPDVPILEPVSRKADEFLRQRNLSTGLLVPYSKPIDSASRSHWQNRECERSVNREAAPSSALAPQPPDMMSLYQTCSSELKEPVAIFLWTRGTSAEDLSPLAKRWQKIGFRLVNSDVVRSSNQQSWSVGLYLLKTQNELRVDIVKPKFGGKVDRASARVKKDHAIQID